jgi:hypothetical protein
LAYQRLASRSSLDCFFLISLLLFISHSVSSTTSRNLLILLSATSFATLRCYFHLALLLLSPCSVASRSSLCCFPHFSLLHLEHISITSHIALNFFPPLSIASILSQLFLISIWLAYRTSFICFLHLS